MSTTNSFFLGCVTGELRSNLLHNQTNFPILLSCCRTKPEAVDVTFAGEVAPHGFWFALNQHCESVTCRCGLQIFNTVIIKFQVYFRARLIYRLADPGCIVSAYLLLILADILKKNCFKEEKMQWKMLQWFLMIKFPWMVTVSVHCYLLRQSKFCGWTLKYSAFVIY